MTRNSRTAIPMRLRNSERSIFLDCRLLFFDAADVAPAGAAVEHAGQLGKLVDGAGGVDFDAPFVEIAGVARETKFHGSALGEVAIAHALHAPADEPSPGVGWFAGRSGHRDRKSTRLNSS